MGLQRVLLNLQVEFRITPDDGDKIRRVPIPALLLPIRYHSDDNMLLDAFKFLQNTHDQYFSRFTAGRSMPILGFAFVQGLSKEPRPTLSNLLVR